MAGFERPEWPPRPAPEYPNDLAGPDDLGLDDEVYGEEPSPAAPPAAGAGGPRDGGRPPRSKGPHRRVNIVWRWRRPLFVAGLLVMALVAAGVSAVARVELLQPDELALNSYICMAGVPDGGCDKTNAMAKLSMEGNRDYVRLEELPEVLVQAVVATEDRDFFEHKGVDPMGIARALYRDIRSGGLTQGGSTITQQYIKNSVTLDNERTLTRKLKEAVLAMKIEKEMSKEEILEGYLNTIYLGRNAYGIAAASHAYFGPDVNVREMNLAHASYLAGLIRAPNLADAIKDPEEAERRRGTVLDAMLEEGYITEAAYEQVEALDVAAYVVAAVPYSQTTTYWGQDYGAEYVTDYVRKLVKDKLIELGHDPEIVESEVTAGGLRIYTTLDPNMQTLAYDAVYRNHLVDPLTDPAAALVALDDQGFVRAMVGGRDQRLENDYAHNNFAVPSRYGRQVGSTFKPIALAAALKDFVSPIRTRIPSPSEVEIPAGGKNPCDEWTPENYASENTATGTLDLLQATKVSSNTAYAQLMYELGPEKVGAMAQALGWSSQLSGCLPDVLGSGGSSPLEMAEVYSTFANRGLHQEPTLITRIDQVDQQGEVQNLWQWQPQQTQVLTEQQADMVTYALQGVIEDGTGTGADIGKDAAGKTGTTQNNRDAWFVGYVPRLTAAVWMGFPEPMELPGCNPEIPHDPAHPDYDDSCAPQIPPMRGILGRSTITGGSIPAEIWQTFMEGATSAMEDEFVDPTPEQLQQGTRLGEDVGWEEDTTSTTIDEGEPDPNSTTTSSTSTSSTTSSSTPPTSGPDPTPPSSFPFPTSTTRPRPGGGGGDPP